MFRSLAVFFPICFYILSDPFNLGYSLCDYNGSGHYEDVLLLLCCLSDSARTIIDTMKFSDHVLPPEALLLHLLAPEK